MSAEEERDAAKASFWAFVQLMLELATVALLFAAILAGPRLYDWLSR